MKDRQKERKNVQLMKRVNELRTAHIMQEITAHNIFSINFIRGLGIAQLPQTASSENWKNLFRSRTQKFIKRFSIFFLSSSVELKK